MLAYPGTGSGRLLPEVAREDQILNLDDSDFYRTRLTHSLEVAQIAGSVTLSTMRAVARKASPAGGAAGLEKA